MVYFAVQEKFIYSLVYLLFTLASESWAPQTRRMLNTELHCGQKRHCLPILNAYFAYSTARRKQAILCERGLLVCAFPRGWEEEIPWSFFSRLMQYKMQPGTKQVNASRAKNACAWHQIMVKWIAMIWHRWLVRAAMVHLRNFKEMMIS